MSKSDNGRTDSNTSTGVLNESVQFDIDPVEEFLCQSKGFGKVIQCTESSGRTVEYLPYLAESVGETMWIRWGSDASQIVPEASVRNTVQSTRPDVTLVDESDSRFCGDSDE